MKPPSTIQLEFDEEARLNNYVPCRSYVPTKLVTSGKKLDLSCASFNNQEVTKVTEGFSKIDLAFREIQVQDHNILMKKLTRNTKSAGRVVRPKTSVPVDPTATAFIVGRSMLPRM
jgi:hypothetical protein